MAVNVLAVAGLHDRDDQSNVLDAPNYSFNTGAAAQIPANPIAVTGGDDIHTTCKWTNTTDVPVTFGEDTENEMCFAFLTYYPKITQPQFNWKIPAAPVVSKCTYKSVDP